MNLTDNAKAQRDHYRAALYRISSTSIFGDNVGCREIARTALIEVPRTVESAPVEPETPYGTAVYELVTAARDADGAMATWFSAEYNSHPIHLRLRKALDAGYTLARCIRTLERSLAPARASAANEQERT